ncbi:MAG: lysophospholipid acyltransferase family protein [Thermodesulfobacteriota bacterium]|jgi:KDO2-lipid IV(A) lauroyltransferase
MSRRKKSPLIKSLEISLVYLLFKLWIFWARHLSLKSLGFYGEKLGTIALHLLRKPRRNALNNLHLALGSEKSEEEIKQICLDSFKNIGRDMMENTRYLEFRDSNFKTLVRLEGKEYLDTALKQGKGVIALTAHLGNFPLMCGRLADEGYPLSIVNRFSKNLKIVKFITSVTDTFGFELIPLKPPMTCVARCFKALKENRILMVHIDLNAPATEAWVDFFGYLVPTFKGPVVFSLRTGAPILPVFTIRNSDSHHKIIIHPPFGLNTTGNSQQDITSNIAQLTKIVEATVREYPEQWWWARPRFKRARDIQTGKSLFPKHP